MCVPREVVAGFEPKDVDRLAAPAAAAAEVELRRVPSAAEGGADDDFAPLPGVRHSRLGLAHDRMHGGVKGRRMSKKDKLRAAAAAQAQRGGAE